MLKTEYCSRYVFIRTRTHIIAAKRTQIKKTLQIKNEMKFLYKKKQQLNKELYYMYIQNANTWKCTRDKIDQSINQKLQDETKIIHEEQRQKIYFFFKIMKKNWKHQ